MSQFDAVVVGAGIIGSCTAYHLQKRGLKTLLIEQFTLGHNNGSSHGSSRVIRYAHKDAPYIPIVLDSYAQIQEFEKKRGEKLWKKTGLLWFGAPERIRNLSNILKGYNLEHSLLSGTEASKKYPQISYGDDYTALFDPMGGVLFADKWLQAFQEEFKSLGGTIHENEELLSYQGGDETAVKTNKGEYHSKKLFICPGSWFTHLLSDLPIKNRPCAITVCYWKPKKTEDIEKFDLDHFPVIICKTPNDVLFGMGPIDYPGEIKFVYDDGLTFESGKAPGEVEQRTIDIPSKHLAEHFPLLDSSQPAHVDRCKYTYSEDMHYIIGEHPKHKNVIICGGMSGTGFKVAPALGRALTALAMGEESPFDLSCFDIQRFLH